MDGTERKIREAIGKRIVETFGRRPLISVRPSEVRAWSAEVARMQSPATARHSLGVLRRVCDYAVQDGAIPRNPATGIRLPKSRGMSLSAHPLRTLAARRTIRFQKGPRPDSGCRILRTSLGGVSRAEMG
jgi:hypothetical protein